MSSTAQIEASMKTPRVVTQPRRRILFADHTATLGGGEIALLNLIRQLDRARFYPIVVLFSDGVLAERLVASGVETHVMPLAASVVNVRKDSLGSGSLTRFTDICRTLAYVFRLRNFIARSRIDLVHTNSLKADIIAGFAARFAGVPLVWHVRDRIADDYLPKHICQIFRWISRWLPNFVIANSQATLSTLGTRTRGTAIYSGTAQIIHDGTRLDPTAAVVVKKPADDFRIGLVGRIAPWKGQHVFIAAAEIVQKRFPQCRFLIIGSVMFGETEYEAQLHTLVKDKALENNTEFTGFREDVPKLIAELDILVHASTTGEPFGQVIIEGMAASKPVVATNGGGVPEIVDDGITGILVPMDDAEALAAAIMRILGDPVLAARMGAAGFDRVQRHFTIKQTAARVQDVYDQILPRHR